MDKEINYITICFFFIGFSIGTLSYKIIDSINNYAVKKELIKSNYEATRLR